jgi:hypothetical protein
VDPSVHMLEEYSMWTTPEKSVFLLSCSEIEEEELKQHYTSLGFDISSYRAMKVRFSFYKSIKSLLPYTTHLYFFESKPSHLRYSMILDIILTCKFSFILVQITYTLTNIHLICITKDKIISEIGAEYAGWLDVEFSFSTEEKLGLFSSGFLRSSL